MDNKTFMNKLILEVREQRGVDAVKRAAVAAGDKLAEVVIFGRGLDVETLPACSRYVSEISNMTRSRKRLNWSGAHSYNVVFPRWFTEIFKIELVKALLRNGKFNGKSIEILAIDDVS